jgi:hypothetical protein
LWSKTHATATQARGIDGIDGIFVNIQCVFFIDVDSDYHKDEW